MSSPCFSYCYRRTSSLCLCLFLLTLIVLTNSSESYYFRNGRVPFYFRKPHVPPAFRNQAQQRMYINLKRSLPESPQAMKPNLFKESSCSLSTNFVNKLEKLISTRRKDMGLWKLWQHWKSRSKHCVIKSRVYKAISPKQTNTGFYHDKNIKSIVTLTGLGGILSSGALIWLSLAHKKKLKPTTKPKKRVIQHLHLHPPIGELAKSEKETEAKSEEESGKKKAAVKIGLAREILAINAESIHLSAHILEFLFIMTKLARTLNQLGMPAPEPKEGNKLLTPEQAQSLIQMIEQESGTGTGGNNATASTTNNSLFTGIGANPLGILGKNVTASSIFQGALQNPAALGLQSLFNTIGSLKEIV